MGEGVHLVVAAPWRNACDNYCNPDDVDLGELTFDYPADWERDDLLVVVTPRPRPALLVVERADAGSDDPTLPSDYYMGPFDFGMSITAIERRQGHSLPLVAGTLDGDIGERLLKAIEVEATSPTSWRDLDDGDCLVDGAAMLIESYEVRCECCDAQSADGVRLEQHGLVEDDEFTMFSTSRIFVCTRCHDRLHRPIGPSADELIFEGRPLCPRCAAARTYEVIRGFPPGPPGPGVLLAGCEITGPVNPNFSCGECDYEWSDDDAVYQPYAENSERTARARIAAIPAGVERIYGPRNAPGRVVIGRYVPRSVSADAAWGTAVYHEFIGDDGGWYLIDPATLRDAGPHTFESWRI